MAALEVALILASIIVPRVTNESYLIEGTDMTIGGIRFTPINEDARNVKFELFW